MPVAPDRHVSFMLLQAQLDAHQRQLIGDLNRQMFADGCRSGPRTPYVPPTWRDRLRRKVLRVQSYCFVLWAALRGDPTLDFRDGDEDY